MVCQQALEKPKASFLRECQQALDKPKASFYEKSITNRLARAPSQSRLARNPYFSTSETPLRKRQFASWNFLRCGGKPAQSHQRHFIGLQSKPQNVVFSRNVGVSKPQSVVFSRNVRLNAWTQRVCKTEVWIHRASLLRKKLCASKRWTSLKPYFYDKSMTNRLDRAPAQNRLARNSYFSTSETPLRKRQFASWNFIRCGGKPAHSHQRHFIGLQSKPQNVVFSIEQGFVTQLNSKGL